MLCTLMECFDWKLNQQNKQTQQCVFLAAQFASSTSFSLPFKLPWEDVFQDVDTEQ